MNRNLFTAIVVGLLLLHVHKANAQQTVFLDFDSGGAGSIVYTATMRADILTLMDGHYAPWDFTFVLAPPGVGPFSTITFNAGSPGGLASHIDFGNTDKGDTAVVNIDGLGIVGTPGIVMASAIIGSHELGHLVGLRHGDSYGPIGSGIHTPPGVGGYLPAYPGPSGAGETTSHIMASPASVGSTIGDVTTPSWFSERSAVKLTMNEVGSFVGEVAGAKGTPATAQALALAPMIVPNTIVAGANAGAGPFSVDAVAVSGAIAAPAEVDFYSFVGSAGDLINVELLSAVSSWKLGFISFDTLVSVTDAAGTPIPYYAAPATNEDEFETFDSILIDLFLPFDGTFFVKVDNSAFAPAATGDYELFVYRFNGPIVIPEPASAAVVFLLVAGTLGLRRRR